MYAKFQVTEETTSQTGIQRENICLRKCPLLPTSQGDYLKVNSVDTEHWILDFVTFSYDSSETSWYLGAKNDAV